MHASNQTKYRCYCLSCVPVWFWQRSQQTARRRFVPAPAPAASPPSGNSSRSCSPPAPWERCHCPSPGWSALWGRERSSCPLETEAIYTVYTPDTNFCTLHTISQEISNNSINIYTHSLSNINIHNPNKTTFMQHFMSVNTLYICSVHR